MRWFLAPQQAQRKFGDLTVQEVKARGMNIEKIRHWKTTAQINEIALKKAKAIEAQGDQEPEKNDDDDCLNPHFVDEESRWSRPTVAAVKSRASPASAGRKGSSSLASSSPPAESFKSSKP